MKMRTLNKEIGKALATIGIWVGAGLSCFALKDVGIFAMIVALGGTFIVWCWE